MSAISEPLTGASLIGVLDDVVRRFAAGDGARFDYLSLRTDPAFGELRAALDGLGDGSAWEGAGRDSRLSAWLNVHNAMVIEAVIALGVRRTVRDVRGFEHVVWRRVAGHTLTLSDLRYGVLGGNRRPPYKLRRPFGQGDARLALMLDSPDPRVRLALIDATRSGPPLAVYRPETVGDQLEATTRAFVNGMEGVAGCPGGGRIALSPLFAWHARDFGGAAAVRSFLAERVDDPALGEVLRAGTARLQLLEYDWGLDKCVVAPPEIP